LANPLPYRIEGKQKNVVGLREIGKKGNNRIARLLSYDGAHLVESNEVIEIDDWDADWASEIVEKNEKEGELMEETILRRVGILRVSQDEFPTSEDEKDEDGRKSEDLLQTTGKEDWDIWGSFKKSVHEGWGRFSSCPWSWNGYLRLLGFLILFMMGLAMFYFFTHDNYVESFFTWIEDLGFWGYFLIILMLVLTQLPFAYGYVVVAMACGFMYEVIKGFGLVALGTFIGLPTAFYFTDFVLREWMEKKIEQNIRLRALVYAAKKNGFKISLFVRLLPVPVGLISGLLCVANIKFLHFYAGSLIGLLPEMFFYTLIGSGASNLVKIVSGDVKLEPFEEFFLGFVIVSSIALSLVMTYYGKKEVNNAMREMEEEEAQKLREMEMEEQEEGRSIEDLPTEEILEMDSVGYSYDEESPPPYC